MKLFKFFDHLEDRTRESLSRFPIVYAIVGGITIVVFWRAIWDMADYLELQGGVLGFLFDPLVSAIVSILVLLVTGLFVSFFIGDRIILSGLKHEKKIEEKTEAEVREEEAILVVVHRELDHLKKEVEEIKGLLKK